MSDLISRQAAINAVTAWLHKCFNPLNRSKYNEGEIDAYETALSELKKIPSAQPEVTDEAVREYCRKRCLCIVDGALLKKYASAQSEIVRCENCGWWQKEWPADDMGRHYCTMVDDRTDREFYCANAERR